MDNDDGETQRSNDDVPPPPEAGAEVVIEDVDEVDDEPETDEAEEEQRLSALDEDEPEENVAEVAVAQVGVAANNARARRTERIRQRIERALNVNGHLVRVEAMIIEGQSVNNFVIHDDNEPTTNGDYSPIQIHFDTNLPAEHSYLGVNMNRVSGVEYFEAGREHRILLFLHPHIIYPGEVVPFMVPGFIIEHDVEANNGMLFGLAFAHVRCPKTKAMYGVTCQIYEMGSDDRGNTLFKSRALQRFITAPEIQREDLEYLTGGPQMKIFANVKILPEIYLLEPLSNINLGSMNRFRNTTHAGSFLRNFQASTTAWPTFVYNQYNINTIVEKVVKSLEQHKIDTMPTDPIRLSFWLARNSHFAEDKLKILFTTDSVNLRLRIIADSFKDGGVFACKFCRNHIAFCRDLFAMSKHGVQSQYCNSAGYIHETNTVYKVITNSIVLTGQPSSEFSWFPGYEWRIIVCRMCNRHIGWQFRSCERDLTPCIFYGISGSSVQIEKETKGINLLDFMFPHPSLNTI